MNESGELNPAQQAVIDAIGATRHERPEFDPDVAKELRRELDARLSDAAAQFRPDAPLFVAKHRLNLVHGCEAQFVWDYDSDDFSWSIPTARGTVAHKAIELSIHWNGTPLPLDLVDEAIGSIMRDDRSLGAWLAQQPPAVIAELRGEANDRVVAFTDTWPPLKPQWRPSTESRVAAEFADGRIRAQGKVDLLLGKTVGNQAGKVVVDFKTGGYTTTHADDLRFYALLETVRIGVPPRMVASYYLDQARTISEPVTEDTLWAAVERLVGGVNAIVELAIDRREPRFAPSGRCRWCSRLDTCAEGQAHLDHVDGNDGADF